MLYERKGHLHILRKPEPHSVDTVLGGTGTSLQIRWARITPGGFMATGLLMLTIQPFVGQPTNNNIATSNNHSATWKIPNTNFFPSSIMQLWKVRQILKVCGSFTKKYENPASHQKPPATCFQHIHRNKCHNLTKLAHRIQFLFRVSSTHGRFLHYWEVSKQSVRPEECTPLARATKEADKARWLPLLRLSEKNRSFKNCGPQSYIESQLLQANLALFLYISNLNRKISKKTCSNSLPEEKLGRKKLSRPEFCSTPPWLSMFFVQ